jgi:hypothetical protein
MTQPTKPDTKPDLILSDLITGTPRRKLILRVSDIHPGSLTLLETLDIMDASGVASSNFVQVMDNGRLREKAMLMMAVAWVIARRAEPDLTFAEVCTYQLDVIGEPRDDDKERQRAETVVAVAHLAGVSTEEAKQMSMTEIEALTNLKRKHTVSRTRPVRRRAS